MARHAETRHRRFGPRLARHARGKAGYLLVGGIMVLIASGAWTLLKLSDQARAQQEAALAASQVETDLAWITGLTFQAQQTGSTAVIQAEIAVRSADIQTNLRLLNRLGLEEEDVAPLTAEVTAYLTTLPHTVLAGPTGALGTVDTQELLPSPEAATLRVESVVRQLQQRAASADVPRRVIVMVTLPILALLIGTMVRWDSRRRRHAALARAAGASHARYEAMVEEGSDLVVLVDRRGLVTYVSSSLPHVLGVEPATWLGRQGLDLIDPQDQAAVAEAFEAVALTGRCDPIDARFLHVDGTWRLLELTSTDLSSNPDVGCVVWHARDVTERRRLEEELARQAFRDSLTGLANRALFQDRLTQTLARAARSGEKVGVVMLDLDGFKAVNDSAGHAVGDALLIQAARRLQASVRAGDTVARLGGDEFAALLEGEAGACPPQAREVAERILSALTKPYRIGGTDAVVSASIGIAVAMPGITPDDLLDHADQAMYEAKTAGKGRIRMHHPQPSDVCSGTLNH